MHLKNKPPIFVPSQFRTEIERLSKAALMDMAWDYAAQCAEDGPGGDEEVIMREFRKRCEIILLHRTHTE